MRGRSVSAESCASDSLECLPCFFVKHYFLVLHVITLNVQKPQQQQHESGFQLFVGFCLVIVGMYVCVFVYFSYVYVYLCIFRFLHPYHNLNLLQLLPRMRTGLPNRYGTNTDFHI